MPDFQIRKARRKEKDPVCVRPCRWSGPNDEMGREIIGPRQRWTVVRIVAGFGRTPLQPMFRRLGNAAALEKAAHAVKAARHGWNRRGRNPVLVDLSDGAVVSAVL